MSLTTDTQRKKALKAISGKSNTLNTNTIYEESISTIIPTHQDHVFAQSIPAAASNPSLYQINGPCEYVRFELEYIDDTGSSSFWTVDPEAQSGSNQVVLNGDVNSDNDPGVEYVALPSSFDGRHSYAVKLPADYLDNSNNPNKDRAKYQNSAKLHESSFKLQIIGLQHGQGYYPKLFSGVGVGAVEIPHDDVRDWVYDASSGIVMQQNPPGPGDFPTNPTYLEGWLYIGDFLDESITALSGSIATDIDTIQEDIVDLQNGGSSATTAIENDLVVKKLLGKAHTSPNKRHYNEAISSYIYSNASHIPSAAPPVISTSTYPYYHIEDNKVEYLRLSGSYVDSGQSVDGRHGIKLHLPNDYVAQSSNEKKGSGYWFNGQSIHGTSGSIQLVPPYNNDNDSNYEAKAYFLNATSGQLEIIPPEDERNWHVDYQAGILYQDSPEDTEDLDPIYVDAWVWVGGMVSEGVGTGGGGNAGGGGGGDGTIGAAEDGTYSDGLFTDFSDTTSIGTAVDRFNEVLKALAPNPAPPMREINYRVQAGSIYSGRLSFDGTHQSANFPFASVETYSQNSAAGFDALTVNDVYQTDDKVVADGNFDGSDLYFWKVGVISGNNVRIEGTINWNVPAKVTANGVRQYENDVFGDGDQGNLYLEVNGVNIHNVNLASVIGQGNPPNGSDFSYDNDSSGFINISLPSSSQTEGGVEFPIFKSRSADFVIEAESMRPGHNKARVKHNKGTVEYVSNYIEWVWDNTTDQITFTNSNVAVLNQIGSTYISGVQYHSEIELRYTTDILNAYKPIYDTGNITTSSTVGTSNPLPFPLIANGENMEKVINFQNDVTVVGSSEPLLNETVDINITVPHPIRGDSTGGNVETDPILLYNPTSSANQTVEDFVLEEFRLQTDIYASQGAGATSGFDQNLIWNSELHMSGSNANHSDGLQIYNGKLLSPINSIDTTRVGDFRSIDDGGVLVTYDDNPDYSVQAGNITGTRTYYRYFRNTTNFEQRDFRIIYRGDTKLITAADTFGVDTIKVSIKLPETLTNDSTGWLDANSQFTMFNYGDNDGGYILPSGTAFDSNIGSGDSINYFTVGQKVIKPDEYVIMRIQADTSWTGHLERLEVQWGASSAGNTAPGSIPSVDELVQIDANQTNGVEGKLSFGQTFTVADYSNVQNVHTGIGGTDVNETYGPSGNTLGIFSVVNVDGDCQPNQSLRILDGHLGELILEINGVERPDYTIDFTDFPLQGDHRIAGTGFYDVSEALPVTYSNGLPNYSRIYRTVKYSVNSSDQVNGQNYVRVIHRIGAEDRATNYIDWVYDPSSTTVQFTNPTMANWSDTDIVYMSGIKYFESPSTTVSYTAEKLYDTIYSNLGQAIGWVDLSRVDITSQAITGNGIESKSVTSNQTSLPNLNKQPLCHLEDVQVVADLNWTGASRVMPGTYGTNANQSVSIKGKVYHPLKYPNGLETNAITMNNFLINTITNSSNNVTNENFSSELYRLPDQTYLTINDVTSASWDSTQSIIQAPYDNGLVQYNGYLVAPSKAGANGDFTSVNDGGIYQGPDGNVDYSNVATQVNERVYLRSFYNNSSSDTSIIDILVEGNGTLSSENLISNPAGAIGNNNRFKMFVKLIEGGSGLSNTEWLDCGEAWTTQNGQNEGVSMMGINNLNVTLSSNSFVKIQFPNGWNFLKNAGVRNYLIIKIVAHKQWTGNITRLGWRLG